MKAYVCAMALVLIYAATPQATAQAAPLQEWTEARTLQVVPGAKAPFGTWSERDGLITAKGTQRCWSTRLAPGDAGPNAKISVGFNIKASSKQPWRMANRPACVRWGHYWYENAPGWDVGVVLRYKDPLNFYRVQLSAHRNDLTLWDSTGEYLQRVGCKIKLGKRHTLEVIARGAHIQAKLDGKDVLDYWDRTLPHENGQAGLAVWQSTVAFDRFNVATLEPETKPMPKHQPNFRLKTVGKQVWVIDGNEPICRFMKITFANKGALYMGTVKLKPGWRSSYYTWIGPGISPNKGSYVLPLVGELPEAFDVKKQGETLEFHFKTDRPDTANAEHRFTIRYDAKRGTYRYEDRTSVQFTFKPPYRLNAFELIDPLTFNNRDPGPEVVHRWNWAGHQWHVFKGPKGDTERYPLIDYLSRYGGAKTHWGRFTDFLYPDPAACPTWEIDLKWTPHPKRDFRLGLCHWGYDFHHTERGPSMPVEPKSVRDFTVVMTGLPPGEAHATFKKSKIAEQTATSPDRFANFDPSGCTFDRTSTRQQPTHTMVWEQGEPDSSVGRRDSYSLRIDGPDRARVQIYQYAVEQNARQWWVRGWFKSKGVGGRGLQLRMKYSYSAKPEQIFYIGGRGDHDWTPFSFVTDVLKQRDCTDLTLELDGPGTVWIDDVAISAILDGKTPKTTVFAEPKDLVARKDMVIDLAMSVKPGRGVYDSSHNGHHLMLEGEPAWKQENGRGFLQLDGIDDGGFIFLRPTIEPLGQGHDRQFPLKAFSYEVWFRPLTPTPENKARQMMIFHYRFNPIMRLEAFKKDSCQLYYQNDQFKAEQIRFKESIRLNRWHHVVATHGTDGKVAFYVDGKLAGEASHKAGGLYLFFAYTWKYSVGRWWFDKSRQFHGDLGPFRLHTKALSAAEVAERFRARF